MSSTAASTVSLTSHCLCKAHTFKTQVPKSKLPLPAPICHCWSCRHVTGALYTSDVRWPEPRANVDVSNLNAFSFSPRVNLLFCPTCSTPMFWEMLGEPGHPLGIFTGTLTNDEVAPFRFIEQSFVADTIDGGASVWLQRANGDGPECKRFKLEASDNAPEDALSGDWPPADELTGFEKKTGDSIPIRCKCKGVDLVLKRGDYSDVAKENLPWNVDPNTHKLSTVFCGCDSCRLQGGIDMWYWTFIAMKHLSAAQGDVPFPASKHELKAAIDRKDPVVGSLAYFASATRAGVLRFFCSTCSATVFFGQDDRPEILDVAVGLFDAPEGARAEGFLSWSFGEVDFKEDADGGWRAQHFDAVEKEAERWRVARGYPKNPMRVGDDTAQEELGARQQRSRHADRREIPMSIVTEASNTLCYDQASLALDLHVLSRFASRARVLAHGVRFMPHYSTARAPLVCLDCVRSRYFSCRRGLCLSGNWVVVAPFRRETNPALLSSRLALFADPLLSTNVKMAPAAKCPLAREELLQHARSPQLRGPPMPTDCTRRSDLVDRIEPELSPALSSERSTTAAIVARSRKLTVRTLRSEAPAMLPTLEFAQILGALLVVEPHQHHTVPHSVCMALEDHQPSTMATAGS
ncbi:hypothetical protein OPT61_g3658 [Boeremia exigua]|uniref:Uncharacterized protein n=1 Tax=Boeremia exigua TaxID=749465 RepID=A0ACC2IH37_9PLEO|nr:hypothetical protein OPT61_g3658 [Boeremia exigua]